jgi:hypothetical protein
MKNKSSIFKWITFPGIFILLSFFSLPVSGQHNQDGLKSPQTLISNWPGWKDKPDTVRVHVDTSFKAAEKDSVKEAARRWNAAGGKPKIKFVENPPAEINMKTDATIGNHTPGTTSYTQDPTSAQVTSCTVSINNRSGHAFTGEGHKIGLTEVLTHELGHCLGMDDTKYTINPADCMRDLNTNGQWGKLSKHDTSEALASAKFWDETALKRAIDIPGVIQPGFIATLTFDLGQMYPPGVAQTATILVVPLADPFVLPLGTVIVDQFLEVTAFIAGEHWQGQLFLDVNISFQVPGYLPVAFLGWQYVDPQPVPPTTFECPFNITFEDGLLVIDWESQCTYPYPGELKSHLTVDHTVYFTKGGGPYILNLNPGTYTITLEVDDFQGNFATNTQIVVVTGINNDLPDTHQSIMIYPNPFSSVCHVNCDEGAIVEILDSRGIMIERLAPGDNTWKPAGDLPKGVYLMKVTTKNAVTVRKVIYI